MDTSKISALIAHGAIQPEHVDKMFAHPDKEKIVDSVIRGSSYKTGLPESMATKILGDRGLMKHHHTAIAWGLGGAGAEKYFKANAGREDFTFDHANALIAAGNHYSANHANIEPHYHRLNKNVRDFVISGIHDSSTEHLNAIDPMSSTVANHLGNHKNADDKTMFNIKESALSPAVKNTALLRMLENRHNKLSGYAVDNVRRHLVSGIAGDRYAVNRAAAQHPATMDQTLHDIVNEDNPGYGTLSAIARHPNASPETKARLKELHGNVQ